MFSFLSQWNPFRANEAVAPSPAHMVWANDPVSEAAMLNQFVFRRICFSLLRDPEADLLSVIPSKYTSRMATAERKPESKSEEVPSASNRGSFLDYLDPVQTATVLRPLSDTVLQLLAQSNKPGQDVKNTPQDIGTSLRKLLRSSTKLHELASKGIVVKCSDEIVAKVVSHRNDTTEYTSLEYLSAHAPDVPAPRPCGLVHMADFSIMFMTYVPSVTLEKVWPHLSASNKFAIQQQLNDIFCRLRTLRREDGEGPLGGPNGEGVKDRRHGCGPDGLASCRTGAEFQQFQLSVPHRGNRIYEEFIRRLYPEPARGSVFSHGDVRPANIMVKKSDNDDNDDSGDYVVSGIIDWECAGFYPDFFESTQMTTNLIPGEEVGGDWWLYLPPCIAPTAFPLRWLADKAWGTFLENVGAVIGG